MLPYLCSCLADVLAVFVAGIVVPASSLVGADVLSNSETIFICLVKCTERKLMLCGDLMMNGVGR